MEISASINGDANVDHHSTTIKFDTFVGERWIVSSATFPPDTNAPIFRMKRKTGLVGKKNIAPFISSPVHCSVTHSLRVRRWLAINLTNIVCRRAYRPTAWRRFRTVYVEIGVPVAEQKCCLRRVAFMLRCLRAVFVKYRFLLGVVASLRPCPGSCWVP